MKAWYDQKAREQSIEVGEEALLHLPTSNKSLEAKTQGPYRVMRTVSDRNYELNVGRTRKKMCTYHISLMKRWKKRDDVHPSSEKCILNQSEIWEDVKLSENLSKQEVTKLQDLMSKYTHISSDKPKTSKCDNT